MNRITKLFIASFIVLATSFTSSNSEIDTLLKGMDQFLRNSKNLHLEFSLKMIDVGEGETEQTYTSYKQSGEYLYLKQGQYLTVQNGQHRILVDHQYKRMILQDKQLVQLPNKIDFKQSLSICKSSTIKDTAGLKKVELTFSKDYPVQRMTLLSKNKKPKKIEMHLNEGGSQYKLIIDYSKALNDVKFNKSDFSTSKYIQKIKNKYQTTSQYSNYTLTNLLKN